VLATSCTFSISTKFFGKKFDKQNFISYRRQHANYLNLDTASLLKMDSNSEVNFELTDKLIGLNLQHGSTLVQVAEQQPNNSIEGRVGNIVLGVRHNVHNGAF